MNQQELANQLIQLIEQDEYKENGKFLSEREIMKRFDIGRSTVRGALSTLTCLGYIYRIHGKGTFVKDTSKSCSLYSVTRSSQSITETGMMPAHDVIAKRIVPASKKVSKNLQICPGDDVLMLNIVRRANAEPINYTVSWVPMLPVFKGLPGKKFAEFSITDILKNQYHVLPKHTIHNIQPVLLSKEVADILETTENFPVLLFESVTWGILNDMVVPIEYFKCYYKTDKSQFSYMQYHTVV